ncbi:MAG: hypothetical protein R2911_30805 [Caldilineaceae bacterium]
MQLNNLSWLPLPWLHIQETVPFELLGQQNYRPRSRAGQSQNGLSVRAALL